MVPNSESGGRLTVGADSRVTAIGRLLRKYKMDELPQLINVLVGQMSMVGPRPEVPEYIAYYSDADRDVVLSAKPGITDNAAIEFRNEQALLAGSPDAERTYIEEILPRKVALYREYVSNITVRGDLVLLFRTAWLLWIRRDG